MVNVKNGAKKFAGGNQFLQPRHFANLCVPWSFIFQDDGFPKIFFKCLVPNWEIFQVKNAAVKTHIRSLQTPGEHSPNFSNRT